MILTRSGFSGIQRYGAVTWSGDVGNDWETLRRQIAGGLGQMAAGLPWWTYDAGGFSALPTSIRIKITKNECCVGYRPEPSCHWCVFMVIWVRQSLGGTENKWNTLFPTFRPTLSPITLYIFTYCISFTPRRYFHASADIWFSQDKEALKQQNEYMFGNSLLINPITQSNVQSWKTYLPEHAAGWIDFGMERPMREDNTWIFRHQ